MKAIDLTDEERIDWLRLIRSDNIGPRTFKSLLRNFGNARAALDALPMLARRGGATRPIRVWPRADAEREIETARQLGAKFIGCAEAAYPHRLAAIDDAPPLIVARGNLAALSRPVIAIVGSRNASAAGLKFAERLARELGEAGFVIASGLARMQRQFPRRRSETVAALRSSLGSLAQKKSACFDYSDSVSGSETAFAIDSGSGDSRSRSRLIASRIPLMNCVASQVEKRRAISRASFIVTVRGVDS